jgi:hypothetical protein
MLTGVESMEDALDQAMCVWNAFWGPLGLRHVNKETLLNNRSLVFGLVEAAVPKLVTDRISFEDKATALKNTLENERQQMLMLLSSVSKAHQSLCIELDDSGEEDSSAIGLFDPDCNFSDTPLDDQVKQPQLPRWLLCLTVGGNNISYEITHNEYVVYFPHVECRTLEQ